MHQTLANSPVNLLPPWPFRLDSSFLSKNFSQIQIPPSGSDVDFVRLLEGRLLPEFEREIECKDHRNAKVEVEPIFRACGGRH